MAFSCVLHGWHSFYESCPLCQTTVTSTSTTTDFVFNPSIDVEKIVSDAFQAGVNRALYKNHPDKSEYIASLNLPTIEEDREECSFHGPFTFEEGGIIYCTHCKKEI